MAIPPRSRAMNFTPARPAVRALTPGTDAALDRLPKLRRILIEGGIHAS